MHVKHLRATTAALRAVGHRYGGGSCRTQVQALLSWCDKAFAHSAGAELHALAGWTAFDAGLGGSAHRHFDLALNFAQDGDLVANIRYRMGRVHLHHGGPAEALGMFRPAGLVATSHHTKAILAANQAWCYAELYDMARSRTFALIALSLNHLVEGDADEAAVVAGLAVAQTGDIMSARTRKKLEPLHAEAHAA